MEEPDPFSVTIDDPTSLHGLDTSLDPLQPQHKRLSLQDILASSSDSSDDDVMDSNRTSRTTVLEV